MRGFEGLQAYAESKVYWVATSCDLGFWTLGCKWFVPGGLTPKRLSVNPSTPWLSRLQGHRCNHELHMPGAQSQSQVSDGLKAGTPSSAAFVL